MYLFSQVPVDGRVDEGLLIFIIQACFGSRSLVDDDVNEPRINIFCLSFQPSLPHL